MLQRSMKNQEFSVQRENVEEKSNERATENLKRFGRRREAFPMHETVIFGLVGHEFRRHNELTDNDSKEG